MTTFIGVALVYFADSFRLCGRTEKNQGFLDSMGIEKLNYIFEAGGPTDQCANDWLWMSGYEKGKWYIAEYMLME